MGYDVVGLLPAFCAAFLGQGSFEDGKIAFHDRLEIPALNYSVASTHAVDDYLDAIRPEKDGIPNQDYTNTVLSAGCYVGEVIRRNGFEEWRWVNYDELVATIPKLKPMLPDELYSAAALLSADNSKVALPFAQVIQNLEEGPEDEIHFFVTGYAADPK